MKPHFKGQNKIEISRVNKEKFDKGFNGIVWKKIKKCRHCGAEYKDEKICKQCENDLTRKSD